MPEEVSFAAAMAQNKDIESTEFIPWSCPKCGNKHHVLGDIGKKIIVICGNKECFTGDHFTYFPQFKVSFDKESPPGKVDQ